MRSPSPLSRQLAITLNPLEPESSASRATPIGSAVSLDGLQESANQPLSVLDAIKREFPDLYELHAERIGFSLLAITDWHLNPPADVTIRASKGLLTHVSRVLFRNPWVSVLDYANTVCKITSQYLTRVYSSPLADESPHRLTPDPPSPL
eukprot:ANDGO_06378.mRNA.1 hypothetical protein